MKEFIETGDSLLEQYEDKLNELAETARDDIDYEAAKLYYIDLFLRILLAERDRFKKEDLKKLLNLDPGTALEEKHLPKTPPEAEDNRPIEANNHEQ